MDFNHAKGAKETKATIKKRYSNDRKMLTMNTLTVLHTETYTHTGTNNVPYRMPSRSLFTLSILLGTIMSNV